MKTNSLLKYFFVLGALPVTPSLACNTSAVVFSEPAQLILQGNLGALQVKSRTAAKASIACLPPSAPGKTFRCQRVDITTVPGKSGRPGGEVVTKGGCYFNSQSASSRWPAPALFSVPNIILTSIKRNCDAQLAKLKQRTLSYQLDYFARLNMRYCYLDLKPKVTKKKSKGKGVVRKQWHTDCGSPRYTRWIRMVVQVPLNVRCSR